MPLRQILVPISAGSDASLIITNAFNLAERHKAHVTVINAFDSTPPYIGSDSFGSGAYYAEVARAFNDERNMSNKTLRQKFDAAVKKSGIAIADRAMQNTSTATFIESSEDRQPVWTFACLCDLVVARRPVNAATLDYGVVEAALFDAKRPTLLLPPKATHIERGGAVAWNGSVEAATALERAIDVLDRDAVVTVIQVGDISSPRLSAGKAVAYLESYGYHAKSQILPDLQGRTTEILLEAAKEAKAGVLVAGAYSHSRMREMILGGVTADLLTKSHLPLLLAR